MYTCQKISIHWLIVDYLIYVGDFLSLPTLLEYVKNLRAEFKSFPWQPPFAMDKFRFEIISEETFTDEIKSLPRLESVPKVDVDRVMSAIKVATFEDSAELITKIEHSLTQPFSSIIFLT